MGTPNRPVRHSDGMTKKCKRHDRRDCSTCRSDYGMSDTTAWITTWAATSSYDSSSSSCYDSGSSSSSSSYDSGSSSSSCGGGGGD